MVAFCSECGILFWYANIISSETFLSYSPGPTVALRRSKHVVVFAGANLPGYSLATGCSGLMDRGGSNATILSSAYGRSGVFECK